MAPIAGRDPKPWPPPFKLSREMVEAMGGADSEGYRAFCAHACEAYNILRKSASLILSLFHLMAGAAIPDVRADPEKVILKLQVCLLLGPYRPHAHISISTRKYNDEYPDAHTHSLTVLVTWYASWQSVMSKSYAEIHRVNQLDQDETMPLVL